MIQSKFNNNLKLYEQPIFVSFFLLVLYSILFILKLSFGIISNSLALQADAYDSLTDVIMYGAAIVGIWFANKKPNERFPYGYYRMENIISLVISILVFFTAYNIITQSIRGIIDFLNGKHNLLIITPLLICFLIISLTITFLSALYLRYIGIKSNSPAIKSEGSEKFFDVLISSSVLIGLIGALYGLYVLDLIISLFISIFIIKGAYEIFVSSTKTLLDAVIDFKQRTELYIFIEKFSKIKKIEKLEIRSYGKYIILELEAILSKNIPFAQIDSLKNNLERELKKKFPIIFKTIIIIHSPEISITKIAIPIKENKGLDSPISEHFGESALFALLTFEQGKLIEQEFLTNPYLNEEKRKGILISEWLINQKCDKIYLKKVVNKGPAILFENSYVEMEITEFSLLKEIINKEQKVPNE
ncbi:MAG: cation diffusion facilitator family transporter [Promethearchaeota archaeon]